MPLTKYTTRNRKAYITLNRPEKRNALNAGMVSELKTHFRKAEADDSVKVIILSGEGKAFCAGADLEALKAMQDFSYEENLQDSKHLAELYEQIYTHPKPVIAMLTGHAIAGGAGLATVCDFIFSVPEAKYGYTETAIGFVPAIVSIFLLRKIGEAKAKELLMAGEIIHAVQAADWGIFNRIFSSDSIQEKTDQFADILITKTSGSALHLTKSLINVVQSMPLGEAVKYAAGLNAKARSGAECKRGVSAFLNKQQIKW